MTVMMTSGANLRFLEKDVVTQLEVSKDLAEQIRTLNERLASESLDPEIRKFLEQHKEALLAAAMKLAANAGLTSTTAAQVIIKLNSSSLT